MRTVYFDTNVFGDIAVGTIPEAEFEKVRFAVSRKEIRIIYTMALMDEQARHCLEKPWGRKAASIAQELCARQGVHDHVRILTDEVKALLGGNRPPSVFMGSGTLENISFLQNWDVLATSPEKVRVQLESFAAHERSHSNHFNEGMKLAKAEVARRRALSGLGPEVTLAELVLAQLSGGGLYETLTRATLRSAGFPERKWRSVLAIAERAPALHMHLLVHLTYTFALLVLNTSTKRSFAKDLIHATYAGRTDSFVTQDGQFQNILRLIPSGYRVGIHDWASFINTL